MRNNSGRGWLIYVILVISSALLTSVILGTVYFGWWANRGWTEAEKKLAIRNKEITVALQDRANAKQENEFLTNRVQQQEAALASSTFNVRVGCTGTAYKNVTHSNVAQSRQTQDGRTVPVVITAEQMYNLADINPPLAQQITDFFKYQGVQIFGLSKGTTPCVFLLFPPHESGEVQRSVWGAEWYIVQNGQTLPPIPLLIWIDIVATQPRIKGAASQNLPGVWLCPEGEPDCLTDIMARR